VSWILPEPWASSNLAQKWIQPLNGKSCESLRMSDPADRSLIHYSTPVCSLSNDVFAQVKMPVGAAFQSSNLNIVCICPTSSPMPILLGNDDGGDERDTLSILSDALLHDIVQHLNFQSILSLSATSHHFQRVLFPLAESISPFRPINTIDYIPWRLAPLRRLSCLPNEVVLRMMKHCDFETLRSLACANRHFMSLPPFRWFQVKLLEIEMASVDLRRKSYLNELSTKHERICRFPCYSCFQAFERDHFSFIFSRPGYDFGGPQAGHRTCKRCCDKDRRKEIKAMQGLFEDHWTETWR
jgi:F-box domain